MQAELDPPARRAVATGNRPELPGREAGRHGRRLGPDALADWMAYACLALTALFAAGQLALIVLDRHNAWTLASAYSSSDPGPRVIVEAIVVVAAGLALSVAGAVVAVASHARPQKRLGWLMLGAAILLSGIHLSGQYSAYAVHTSRHPPFQAYLAAWPWEWAWQLVFLLIFLVLLLFPTGRLPAHRRWHLMSWVLGAALILSSLLLAVEPGSIYELKVDNPIILSGVPSWFSWITVNVADNRFLLVLAVAAGALALADRCRDARGNERQQLKVVMYGAFMGLLLLLAAVLTSEWSLALIGLTLLPIFTAVGILYWQLFDIDELIARTAVYGLLWTTISLTNVLLIYGVEELSHAPNVPVAGVGCAVVDVFVFEPLRLRIDRVVRRWRPQPDYGAARS